MIPQLGDRALKYILWRDSVQYRDVKRFYLTLLPALLAYTVVWVADVSESTNRRRREFMDSD